MKGFRVLDNHFDAFALHEVCSDLCQCRALFLWILTSFRDHFNDSQLGTIEHAELDEHEQIVQLEGSAQVRFLDNYFTDTALQIFPEEHSKGVPGGILWDVDLFHDLSLG